LFSWHKEKLAAPCRLLIDDRSENVKAFRDAGGSAILVPRPWNDGSRERFESFLQLSTFGKEVE